MGVRIEIDRIALLKDKESGLSVRQLANKYDVGYGTVRRYLSDDYLTKSKPEPTPAAPPLARVGSIPLTQVGPPLARIGSHPAPPLARTKNQPIALKKPATGLNKARMKPEPQKNMGVRSLKYYSIHEIVVMLLLGWLAIALFGFTLFGYLRNLR